MAITSLTSVACNQKAQDATPESQKSTMNQNPPLKYNEKTKTIADPASVAEYTAAIKMAISILAQSSQLEENNHYFGIGSYAYAKNSAEIPFKAYTGKEFSTTFFRDRTNDPWKKVKLVMVPDDPKKTYVMGISKDFFNEMTFDISYITDHPDRTPPEKFNIFGYTVKKNKHNLKVKIRSRQEVSNIQDPYPSSFQSIEITRLTSDE